MPEFLLLIAPFYWGRVNHFFCSNRVALKIVSQGDWRRFVSHSTSLHQKLAAVYQ